MTNRSGLFGARKPVIGMIHLPALPGAPNYGGEPVRDIVAFATADARVLEEGGFDGVLLQNTNDRPPSVIAKPPAVAAFTVVAAAVRALLRIPVGINVLKSDAVATLGIASAVDAQFVRLKGYVGAEVGAEGLVQGCAPDAIRARKHLFAEDRIEIWADALQPTSRLWPTLEAAELARWCVEFGLADRVVVTGNNLEESIEVIARARRGSEVRLILGGGTEPATAARALEHADGVIVGRYLRGASLVNPIDPKRAEALITAIRAKAKA